MMNRILPLALLCAATTLAGCATTDRTAPGKPEYMVVGIDTKVTWGDDGKVQFGAPGKDSVTIVDIGTDPANPKIVANLPLMNSIFGPPTNLAITTEWTTCAGRQLDGLDAGRHRLEASAGQQAYVIDLTTSPPRLINTVSVGKHRPACQSIAQAPWR